MGSNPITNLYIYIYKAMQFLKKKSYVDEIENNSHREEIERMKSNICAMLAKRVKEKKKKNKN